MNKRTRSFLLFVAAILLGLWLGRLLRPSNSQLQGILSFDPAKVPMSEFPAGNFNLRWDDQAIQLTIEHKSRPGFPLWQSLPGESFVQAALGQETVTERRGMFTVRDHWEDTCPDQEIGNIGKTTDNTEGIEIYGRLYCKSGQEIAYSIFFYSYEGDPNRLEINLAAEANRVFLTYSTSKNEHFFGFGEQFSFVDMKGRRVPIWVNEQGVGRGDQPITIGADLTNNGAGGDKFTTYAPIPFYITNQMRSVLVLNSGYSAFDLRNPNQVQVEVFGGGMIANILVGTTPEQILTQLAFTTGLPAPLPDWVHAGAIVGLQGGTEKVRSVYDDLNARKVPIAAFWLQDWVGQRQTTFGSQLWWNWEVDYDRYPGWDLLVQELKNDGIRTMVYINPNLVDVTGKRNARRNLFQEAIKNDYLVKTTGDKPYLIQNTSFDYGLVDLTNPNATKWLINVIEEQVIGAGAAGWMADFGEGLPYDAVLSQPNDENASTLHNRWPVIWAGLNQSVLQRSEEELVFFSRSGFTGSQVFTSLFWEGDQIVSWGRNDGIKSAITGMNSGSLSGMTFNHSDIGGYTTVSNPIMTYNRSQELLLRWMEMNAFSPIFRTHEGNQPEKNIQFYSNGATLDSFAYWAKVFAALFPYRKSLIVEAAETGMPVVRHPIIHYPDDPEIWKITYQEFMLGSDFLVAPVTNKGADTVKVYLPAGQWVHVWTGKVFSGGQYYVIDSPLGQPAVFFQLGSSWGEDFRQKLIDEELMP